MKKYRVKVNGKLYEVELEVVEENKESVKVEHENVPVSEGNKTVNAPIGGKVLDVKVNVGDKVKKGTLVCVIEAMKMENEVLSSVDGVVKEVRVKKGSQVAAKDVLVVVE